jgi:putative transcriptional regulator
MGKSSDEREHEKLRFAKDIIGEIGVSDDPPASIKKWRTLFRVSQKELARKLGISSSVVSDYESGRRKSPGVLFLRRYVDSLIKLDEMGGGEVLRLFSSSEGSAPASAAIVDIKEFRGGIGIVDFCAGIGAKIITRKAPTEGLIYGYTIIDSVKAITEMPFGELRKLYGVTTRRALIFTNITTGKGPLIAIKVANLKPALIVLHDIPEASVSEVAKNIAEVEGVPLSICEKTPLAEIIERSAGFSAKG